VNRSPLVYNVEGEQQVSKEERSEFISHSHAIFKDRHHYYQVMKWAQGGSLASLIQKNSKRNKLFTRSEDKAIRFLLGCVIMGLENLHSQNNLFWHLKP
jgi:serine/threonine protein kinase